MLGFSAVASILVESYRRRPSGGILSAHDTRKQFCRSENVPICKVVSFNMG